MIVPATLSRCPASSPALANTSGAECSAVVHASGRKERYGTISQVLHQSGASFVPWSQLSTSLRVFRRTSNGIKAFSVTAGQTVLCVGDRIEVWHSAQATVQMTQRQVSGGLTQIGYATLEPGSVVELGSPLVQLKGPVTYHTWDNPQQLYDDRQAVVKIRYATDVVATRSTFRIDLGEQECSGDAVLTVSDEGDYFSEESDPRDHGVLLERTNEKGERAYEWVRQNETVQIKAPTPDGKGVWVERWTRGSLTQELEDNISETNKRLFEHLNELKAKGELDQRPEAGPLTPNVGEPLQLVVYNEAKPNYVFVNERQVRMERWQQVGESDVWLSATREPPPLGESELKLDYPGADKDIFVKVNVLAASTAREERREVKVGPCGAAPTGGPTGDRVVARPVSAAPLELISLSGGTFCMGSADDAGAKMADERPMRAVTVGPFALGKHEVTRFQWREVVSAGQARGDADALALQLSPPNQMPATDPGGRLPVGGVSWCDTVRFANVLSRLDELTPAYSISADGCERGVTLNVGADGYRLPTEAEWEYAARAGTWTTYAHGEREAQVCEYGNVRDLSFTEKVVGFEEGVCRDGFEWASPVCSFEESAWGFCDMAGNLYEWTWDRYAPSYDPVELLSPLAPPQGAVHTLRGGAYDAAASAARPANREQGAPGPTAPSVGFRLARSER